MTKNFPKTIAVNLKTEVYNKVKQEAEKYGSTITDVVRRAIAEYVIKNEEKLHGRQDSES